MTRQDFEAFLAAMGTLNLAYPRQQLSSESQVVYFERLSRFAKPAAPPPLLDADRHGYTRREYDHLCQPGGLRFAPVRWLMKGPGR